MPDHTGTVEGFLDAIERDREGRGFAGQPLEVLSPNALRAAADLLDQTIADTAMTPEEFDARNAVWRAAHRLADVIDFVRDRPALVFGAKATLDHRSDLREILRLATAVSNPAHAVTVDTVEGLDALRVGTVIRAARGGVWVVSEPIVDGTRLRYVGVGGNDYYNGRVLLELHGPLTVIWTPPATNIPA